MKNIITNLICFAASFFYMINLTAQWCIPETAIPYAPSMPGITHVTLNTIDRASADLENYPENSYVYTGESTTLVKGVSYEMTINFTVDAFISPDMNIRVWIDLDHNGSFDDIGETVLSEDHIDPNEFTDSFYLPDYALTGETRMRVTAKMTSLGGHSLPTPCDMPQDPLGYHGEFEDYDIIITESTAIDQIEGNTIGAALVPNPANNEVSVQFDAAVQVDGIEISSMNGNRVAMISDPASGISGNAVRIRLEDYHLTPGIYYVTVYTGKSQERLKLVIVK